MRQNTTIIYLKHKEQLVCILKVTFVQKALVHTFWKFDCWHYCLSLCVETFDHFPLFDETFRHKELCNRVISQTFLTVQMLLNTTVIYLKHRVKLVSTLKAASVQKALFQVLLNTDKLREKCTIIVKNQSGPIVDFFSIVTKFNMQHNIGPNRWFSQRFWYWPKKPKV